MQTCVLKAVLGVSVSVLVVSATNVAQADDPTNGGFYQLHYTRVDPDGINETYDDCVSVGNTAPNNGAQIISWSCKPSTAAKDQAWYFDPSDCFTTTDESTGATAQWCSLRNGENFNKCLGIAAGSRNAGTHAMTWDCLGKSHYDQYWLFQPTGSGTYQMVNYNMFSMGLGPVGQDYVGVPCPPIPYANDCYVEEDYLGLTSQMSTFTATFAQP